MDQQFMRRDKLSLIGFAAKIDKTGLYRILEKDYITGNIRTLAVHLNQKQAAVMRNALIMRS